MNNMPVQLNQQKINLHAVLKSFPQSEPENLKTNKLTG